MYDVIVIFILQVAFQFFRVLSTKAIIAEHTLYLMLNTTVLQALWLVTTYLGVMGMSQSNWYVVSSYMIGGVLGAYLALQIKGVENRDKTQ